MKALDLFLKSLGQLTEDYLYIKRLTITPQKPMTVYKEFNLEVNILNKKTKDVIKVFRVTDLKRVNTEDVEKKVINEIVEKMIILLLKYYKDEII